MAGEYKSFLDFENNPDTVLTNPAPTDLFLLWDRSEPLDINKVKVISYQNLVNLAAQSALQALVSGQAAGDMFYASSATALARVAKGTAGQVLKMNSGATAPEWGNAAGLVDIQIAKSTSGKTYSTATWEDHPGLSVTLTLPKASTVLILADITGNVNTTLTGYGFFVRGMIDGVADGDPDNFNGSINPSRNEVLSYTWFRTSVPAGSRIVKIQSKEAIDGIDN
jgi:hypothetical protein